MLVRNRRVVRNRLVRHEEGLHGLRAQREMRVVGMMGVMRSLEGVEVDQEGLRLGGRCEQSGHFVAILLLSGVVDMVTGRSTVVGAVVVRGKPLAVMCRGRFVGVPLGIGGAGMRELTTVLRAAVM